MKQEEQLKTLIGVARGMAKLLGPDTEVVVHNLVERKIVFVVNGYITNRDVGYKIDDSIYDTILKRVDKEGHLIGYTTHTREGKKLRSSHFVFYDESGEPCTLFCINQDVTKLEEIRDLIDTMVRSHPMTETVVLDQGDENYIQRVVQQVILDAMEKTKPTSFGSKEGKLEVIRSLETKGVFDVKDAVPTVCRVLSISQATLYNYLRELRSHEKIPSGPRDMDIIL